MTDKRQKILDAARTTLAIKGFHGTTMSDISRQAGVAAGTLYLYFEDKDTLLEQTLADNLEQIAHACFQSHDPSQSPHQQFVQIWTALAAFLIEHPQMLHGWELSRHVTDKARLHQLQQKKQTLFMPIRELFETGLNSGQLKPIPMELLAAIGLESCAALVRRHIDGQFLLDEKMIAIASEASWQAIAS
ncbi:TetR/AcrR family transcriptional regulator [Corallincola platygyrae]|uniref:TetR/AcrR family transcriptional regulator n=1 Tax=Corallincola platygyrae TaxID=1193278 RepID=A0ABW4XKM1_9GAMM